MKPWREPMNTKNTAGPSLKYVCRSRPALYALPRKLEQVRRALSIVCALLLACICSPVSAQRDSHNIPSAPPDPPEITSSRSTDLEALMDKFDERDSRDDAPVLRQPSFCLLEPYPGSSKTVSVRSLHIPNKAKNEFEKACVALVAHKLQEAEQHVRKGLQIYPADAMGWVALGKLLEMQDHIEDAGEACSQGAMHDPSSWTAALCLAEIYGCEHKWANTVAESNLAMSLNPESKRFADYFSAVALYNLDRLAEAESRALEAEQLDRGHELPRMELLVARIEESKGDSANAIAQLREYLKYAKDSPQTESAKKDLARLESETK